MESKILYAIENPFTGEPIFVAETSDLETRIEAHKLWCANLSLGLELQEIRAAGKEPVYTELERVNPGISAARLSYWLFHYKDLGCKLHNKIPNPKKKPKRKPVDMEVSLNETVLFTIPVPRAIAENPQFKKHVPVTPDEPSDLLGAYIGQLLIQDFAKKENSLSDFLEWLYK